MKSAKCIGIVGVSFAFYLRPKDMQIKTAGELRGFLADVMVGIRAGSVECDQAHAISKIAAQINQSLATEVNTALQLERMGKDRPIAGSMLIGNRASEVEGLGALPVDTDGMVWCDQCDGKITPDDALACKSKFCSLKRKKAA
jgi:hypothetical protein